MEIYKNYDDIKKINHNPDKIERQINSEFIDSQNNSRKQILSPRTTSEKSKKYLNDLIFENFLKELEIAKLKTEIQCYTNLTSDKPIHCELSLTLDDTLEKTKNLIEINEEYEHLKIREGQKKLEWKSKLNKLKLVYEKFEKQYLNAVISRDTAINNYFIGKQQLIDFTKLIENEKTAFDHKVAIKRRIKDSYESVNRQLIQNIGVISYNIKSNKNKIKKIFSQAALSVEESNKYSEEFRYVYSKLKDIHCFIESAQMFLASQCIPSSLSLPEIIYKILELYKQAEYKFSSLSLRFQDLSSLVFQLKSICSNLISEHVNIHSAVSSNRLEDNQEELNETHNRKGAHEENLLIGLYAGIYTCFNDMVSRLRRISAHGPDNQRSFLPDLEEVQTNVNQRGFLTARKSLKLVKKSKTFLRMNTKDINYSSSDSHFTRKSLPVIHLSGNISTLCEKYFNDSEKCSAFIMKNQMILLFFQQSELMQLVENSIMFKDKQCLALYIYDLAHVGLRNLITRSIEKISDSINTIKEFIPKDFEYSRVQEQTSSIYRAPELSLKYKVSQDHHKFYHENDTTTKKMIKRKLKHSLETSESLAKLQTSMDTFREIRSIENRLRKIKMNEKIVSNSVRESTNSTLGPRIKFPSISIISKYKPNS